ncbi:MAG: hypothetical protein IPP77_06085 [Bacteroidetes bacterium]|nr:hypothetical protein [Bacteroidota bacterium]
MHDMLRIYVGERKWTMASFDLLLGMPCEIIATPKFQTFLPDYLIKYFNCTTIDGSPFITNSEYLLKYPSPEIHVAFQPLYLALIFLLIGIVLLSIERIRSRWFRWFDFILYSITGLLGVILVALWLFTSHYAPPFNLNLFWLLPTHLPIAFLLLKKQVPHSLRYYFLATFFIQIFLLLGWNWLPQPLNIAFLPLIILLAIRSASMAFRIK